LQLQILFQRVLRRAGIGVDESFFELGGDSLQALELIVQIEKATGKRLPLEALFQTPSVERLATELQRNTKGDEWSAMVPLQKSGHRPPLFLVHTTPGDILGYGNLVHHLGSDQPCYGFQALGFKDGALPHDSIEAMAAYYIELLRKFQAAGPYYLGGWCFGGIVAFEMAQQLRAAGQEIAGLLLMETVSVTPGPGNLAYHLQRFKCLASMSPDRWRRYLIAKAKYRRQVEMDNRMRFKQAGENVDPGQRRWLARLEQVYNANLIALEKYRSKPYDGKVTLFNAIERDAGVIPDPYYGWVGIASDIEVHEVAGDHDTMLAEPNATSLASAVRKVLSKK
jgi:thioesterase domain-containing protein/acyl carrier protein